MRLLKTTLVLLCLSVLSLPVFAQQEQTDSLVRLISAASAKVFEINGQSVRKVSGHAQFLHIRTETCAISSRKTMKKVESTCFHWANA